MYYSNLSTINNLHRKKWPLPRAPLRKMISPQNFVGADVGGHGCGSSGSPMQPTRTPSPSLETGLDARLEFFQVVGVFGAHVEISGGSLGHDIRSPAALGHDAVNPLRLLDVLPQIRDGLIRKQHTTTLLLDVCIQCGKHPTRCSRRRKRPFCKNFHSPNNDGNDALE